MFVCVRERLAQECARRGVRPAQVSDSPGNWGGPAKPEPSLPAASLPDSETAEPSLDLNSFLPAPKSWDSLSLNPRGFL